MPLNVQDKTVVVLPRTQDLSRFSMNDLFSDYGKGDGTELRQGEYFQPTGKSNREAWDEYQAMVAEDARIARNKEQNSRFLDIADKATSPLTMATDLAGVDEDSPVQTVAELAGPGEVFKGGKMLIIGAAGSDWLKKFLMGKAKKPRPNAFNTPGLAKPIGSPDVKPTLDDIRPYVPKEKPPEVTPSSTDEINLFDEDAIELIPYTPSQRWQMKQKREGLLRELDDVQQKGKQLDEYQTRIDRAIRMLERKKMEAAEDAIELRPYTPKKKDIQ